MQPKKELKTAVKFLWARFFSDVKYDIWIASTLLMVASGFIDLDFLPVSMMGLTFFFAPGLFLLFVYPSVWEFRDQYRVYRKYGFMTS